MTGAGEMISSAGGPFNQSEFDQWMSPYITGVVDRIGDLGARNLHEKLLPGVNTTFTGAGQFGSSRHADFTNRAIRDANESILGQQNMALQGAHDSAMTNYGNNLNRRLDAGQSYGTLGEMLQGANLRDAAAMEAIGGTQQGQTQRNYDLAYGDFQAQNQYPQNQASWLSNILYGNANPGGTTTRTEPSQNGSPISQLGGLALGAGSLYAGLSGAKFNKGGLVRRMNGGGPIASTPSSAHNRRHIRRPSPSPLAGIPGAGGGMAWAA